MSTFATLPDQLRTALDALFDDPRALAAPDEAIPKLRPIVESARAAIAFARRAGAAPAEAHAAELRLIDTAVTGLLGFARAALDGDISLLRTPLACVAMGSYAAAEPSDGDAPGILFLLGDRADVRVRGESVARFIAHGLRDLGIGMETTTRTLGEATALAGSLPRFAERIAGRRFVDGCYDLYGRFAGIAPVPLGLAA